MPTETSADHLAVGRRGPGRRRASTGPRVPVYSWVKTWPSRRAAEVADERLPDLAGVGVGVAGPVQRHHDHEVDAGVARGPARRTAGARARRVGVAERRDARWGSRRPPRPRPPRGRSRSSRASRRASYAARPSEADDEDEHDQHLQQQDLARHRRLPSGADAAHAAHCAARRGWRAPTNSTNTTVTGVTSRRHDGRDEPGASPARPGGIHERHHPEPRRHQSGRGRRTAPTTSTSP